MPSFNEGSFAGNQLSLTDVVAGDYRYEWGFTRFEYFSLLVSATSGFTVTLEGTNDDVHWYDVTNELLGVAGVVPGEYFPNRYIPVKNLRIRAVTLAAPNKLDMEWFMKKGGGR